LVILRPDGRTIVLPAMAKESAPADAVAAVERMLPSSAKRNVATIADTSWTGLEKPGVREAGRAIPYFGLLMGFAAIGHAVWIFDGKPGLFAAGVREADLLIIDSAQLEGLPPNWQALAGSTMRTAQIVVHDRATQRLRKV
jgi:hypothetical protein